jgi:hypothetical protein
MYHLLRVMLRSISPGAQYAEILVGANYQGELEFIVFHFCFQCASNCPYARFG